MEQVDGPIQESKRKILEVIDQAIKEEEEKRAGIWTKIYEGISPDDQEHLLKSASNVVNKFLRRSLWNN